MNNPSLSLLRASMSKAGVSADELSYIASEIDATSARLTAVKHHARLFADLALTVSDATTSIRVDAAAMGEVMVFFTAELEEAIDSLSNVHASMMVLGESSLEVER